MPGFRTYQNRQVLCITFTEIVEACGVSEGYLKKALHDQRKQKVSCWPHHKEGQNVYVHYDGLKPKYQHSIKKVLCGNVDPYLFLANEQASKRQQEIEWLNSNLPDHLTVQPSDIKILSDTGFYDPETIHRIARAAAWLRLLCEIDVKKARKMGYHKITQFQQAVFQYVTSEQSKGLLKFKKVITNERVLDRNARLFAKEGIKSLISGLIGNGNRTLITPVVHAKLMDLASDRRKLSFEDIGDEYDYFAVDNGLPRLTVEAIKQHLNEPKFKRVWYYNRHGKHAGDLEFRSQSTRREVSRPDMLWSMDGTTMQLYYRDENGKVKSDLYVYLITDVHSSAIIGASVGLAETSGLVVEAIQNAVNFRNHVPFQFQYDNSSANQSDAVTGLMKNMSRVHFGCRPYSGQSKYVETFTGHFQQRVLHKYEFFKGGNITAKSDNAKANPELLKEYQKNPDRLPSMDEVIGEFYKAVETWNGRGSERDAYGHLVGKTKLEKYEQEHADRVSVNYFDKISLFMSEMPGEYTYGQAGIKLTINKEKYWFVVPDMDDTVSGHVTDNIFQRNWLGQKFNIRINYNSPEFIVLFHQGKRIDIARNKTLLAPCVGDYKPGEGAIIRDFWKKQEEFGWKYAQSELDRQRALLADNNLLKATGTDGFQSWEMQDKLSQNQIESQLQDELNGMGEPSELQKRLIKLTK